MKDEVRAMRTPRLLVPNIARGNIDVEEKVKCDAKKTKNF